MAREAAASAKGGTNLGGGSGQPPLSQEVRFLQGPHSPRARQKTLSGTNSAPASV